MVATGIGGSTTKVPLCIAGGAARRDSCQLTDDLDRYLRGNPKAFSVVGVPSEEQEEKRALIRYHLQIMEDRGHCGRHEWPPTNNRCRDDK